jgi:glycosyltransferase involved in cell wall biosynthesis
MHWFIVPDLDGPMSGGTLFNRMLIAATNQVGCPCRPLPLEKARAALVGAAGEDTFWVDSLYLDEFPALRRAARTGTQVGLILHYLPSLVTLGGGVCASELTSAEVNALQAAGTFLVPSPFMRGAIERLAGVGRTIVCVEPGRLATGLAPLPIPPARAVMVANLVPGKSVEPFLVNLADRVEGSDDFCLTVIGGDAFDPPYAERCRRAVDDLRLRGRVVFAGALSPEETVRRLAASNLFVSASVMESFGMALAEARTLGLPIVACTGGNVATLVDRMCGGQLVGSPEALASAFLAICRDTAQHRRRMASAKAGALPARSWIEAAREFSARTAGWLGLDPNTPTAGEGSAHVRRA